MGGVTRSHHQRGDALDMQVGDIDRNRRVTPQDKRIVIQILEHEVIGRKGGIGMYPGTRTVHRVLRGYRVRWNSY